MMDILELSIEELFPNILNRQYFFVYPDESVYLASVCLIPAIEVYIDGVIVIENNKPIGRIGSKHILGTYYVSGREAFYKQSKEIMEGIRRYLTMDSSFKDLLGEVIHSRLGFVPIVNNGIIAVTSLYDILRVVAKSPIDTKLASIGSKTITIDNSYSIKDAIETMVIYNIRRLFIKEDDEFYNIVGRDILDFLVQNEVVLNNPIDITKVKVDVLSKRKVAKVEPNISIKDAAVLLLKQQAPSSLVMTEYVITPLDIVIEYNKMLLGYLFEGNKV